MTTLTVRLLGDDTSVVRMPSDSPSPGWLPTSGFSNVTRTGDELSIVCPTAAVPDELRGRSDVAVEDGWTTLMLVGPFEFHLTGILLAVLEPLAAANVGIFAISTYDTDYVLVKTAQLDAAVAALRSAGHIVG